MTGATVISGGRRKAYRPLSPDVRAAAFEAGLAAYAAGDFFAAHEHWEPAWMGTADAPERDLYSGLIKLAAAHVHAVRGNPAGYAKNLAGARERLRAARDGGAGRIDLDRLLGDIEPRARGAAAPPAIRRLGG